MSQSKPLILFDLDGTLLDSLRDIAACCNRALEQCGYPAHPAQLYKTFVGNGADQLLHRALPAGHTQQEWELLKKAYMPLYLECCQQGGALFPGVTELMGELRKQGALLAAVSNKPHEHTCACCRVLFDGLLDGWLGDYPGIALKPDPAGVRAMESYLDSRCVALVGDSVVDVQTAKNAGAASVAVSWGMQPRQMLVDANPDAIADDFTALKQILLDILSKCS